MWNVEITHTEILAPIGFTGVNFWIETAHGEGFVQATFMDVIENEIRFLIIGNTKHNRQNIAEGIKAVSIIPKSHIG